MSYIFFADAYSKLIISKRNASFNFSPAGSKKIFAISKSISIAAQSNIKIVSRGLSNYSNNIFSTTHHEKISSSIYYIGLFTIRYKGIRDIVAFIQFVWVLIKNNRSIKTVIFYNISLSYFLIAVLAKFLNKKIWLEYEDSATINRLGYNSFKSLKGNVLEFLFSNLVDLTIGCNTILLDRMNSEKILIPGIVEDVNISKKGISNYLFYSGGLDDSKGIKQFTNLFLNEADNPFDSLIITGKGSENDINFFKNIKNEKVQFKGLLDEKAFMDLLVNAKVCVNPHIVNIHEGGSYPFKVIEYLAYNGCVISTDCNHPSDIRPLLYLINDSFDEIGLLKNVFNYSNKCESNSIRKEVVSKYDVRAVSIKFSKIL